MSEKEKVLMTGNEAMAEAAILARYREFLGYAKRPAFAAGGTWDLTYCNEAAPGYDPDRHFAFVRFDAAEAWLVACNFSGAPAPFTLSLPPDLRSRCPLVPETASADIPAWDAAVLRL